jgi:hypothetical protein
LITLQVERRVPKDPSVFQNPKIKYPPGLYKWDFHCVTTIEIEEGVYQGLCNQDPESLGFVAEMLKEMGLQGEFWLKESKGYRKLRRIGCKLVI